MRAFIVNMDRHNAIWNDVHFQETEVGTTDTYETFGKWFVLPIVGIGDAIYDELGCSSEYLIYKVEFDDIEFDYDDLSILELNDNAFLLEDYSLDDTAVMIVNALLENDWSLEDALNRFPRYEVMWHCYDMEDVGKTLADEDYISYDDELEDYIDWESFAEDRIDGEVMFYDDSAIFERG